MTEKHGFVYIWYDKKHKRYYIGSHWGHKDDGYVCSSSWMKQAYAKRPRDFKRRIILKVDNIKELREIEHQFLQKAKSKKQLYKNRYYNHHFSVGYYEVTTELKQLRSERTKAAMTPERRLKMRLAKLGKPGARRGFKASDETKAKISRNHRFNNGYVLTEAEKLHLSTRLPSRQGTKHTKESRQKMSESSIGQTPWNIGVQCREETKEKLRQANKGQIPPNKGCKTSDETKAKQSARKKGRVLSTEHRKQIAESVTKH